MSLSKWFSNEENSESSHLKKELIHGLEVLDIEDKDIKSLVIWCNPNYIIGPDYEIEIKLKSRLEFLIRTQIVVISPMHVGKKNMAIGNLFKSQKKKKKKIN